MLHCGDPDRVLLWATSSTGHGACVLRQPALDRIVADARHHFEGDRYTLGDFVVMPNHVPLLVGGMARGSMFRQVESWKKWTALKNLTRHRKNGRLPGNESEGSYAV